jgi:hypothetical protein
MARNSRPYSVEFHNVSVSVVQDLISVYCGASMGIELQSISIGQITGLTVQNLRISIKRLASAVTAGTGGAAVTPKKMMRGDVAATVTARANDSTTQASSSGATDILLSDVFNTVNGYQWGWGDNRPTFGLSEACILSLDQAPTSPLFMSGTLCFGELL